MSSSNVTLTDMRRNVEQLKLQASVERIKVSQAAAELQHTELVLVDSWIFVMVQRRLNSVSKSPFSIY
ncbi:hypothetical protein KOW79_022151 [Hemibagrus wyckioides]|uniref:G protein gamma domain-containing protein n=1 Tax=Hemibagrus wyckioides TaxID=337641 RepID=A0A9D3N4U0_9TELE|nr:hypothetical protein KOW79_022151 [Hemibagrus wyckioides]